MAGAMPVAARSRPVVAAPAGAADMLAEPESVDVRAVVRWAAGGDSGGLPFAIVDKRNARVFAFDRSGRVAGAAAALLGLGRGDDSAAGIGGRRLATITPCERTTPAGRFQAALGHDLEQDILWIDYDSALSMHRVIVGNPRDQRRRRLASASPLNNRINGHGLRELIFSSAGQEVRRAGRHGDNPVRPTRLGSKVQS